ncbi:hypothetical protein FHX69_1406 [Prauserella muralis]|nr:hypothetical protein FHX69_1406 [Prauserella muralis]
MPHSSPIPARNFLYSKAEARPHVAAIEGDEIQTLVAMHLGNFCKRNCKIVTRKLDILTNIDFALYWDKGPVRQR